MTIWKQVRSLEVPGLAEQSKRTAWLPAEHGGPSYTRDGYIGQVRELLKIEARRFL